MKNSTTSTRRNFLKQASLLSATAVVAPARNRTFPFSEDAGGGENYSFLFQGDSITDGNRSRNTDWNHVLGHGYAYLIAADLLYRFPSKKFQFFNRGISGNQITDLTKRWSEDTVALKPDLVSILIGVNDAMNGVNGNKNSTVARYETEFRILLEETKQQLPEVELVICEPFILPVGTLKTHWNEWYQEISGRQEAAKKIAMEFQAIFIPLQDLFNEKAAKYPPGDYWLWDGIHPMPNGHELITGEWVKQVGKKLTFIR